MARFFKSLAVGTVWMLVVAVATLVIGVGFFPMPVEQPLSYNHKPHVDLGCEFCHQGVTTRAHAGLPEISLCLDCHESSPVKDAAGIAAWNRAVEQKHIPWKKLTRMHDHVYFSHQRHVGLAKIECAVCHGDMAERTSPPPHPLKVVTMAFCTDCHAKQRVADDCAHCHK